MKSVEEKLAQSLTAESIELIPYLSYLLQDLWELGSSPKDMFELIEKHVTVTNTTTILDLACGKGAVGIHLAKHLNCQIKGIDLMPEFINYAKEKAIAYGVSKQSLFLVGDINESINTEKNYDIVILGAVGTVLGTELETIKLLKQTVKKNGYIIIDDGYGQEESSVKHLSKKQWLSVFNQLGIRLVADKIIEDDELDQLLKTQLECIDKRVNELKKKYPDQSELFDSYIKSQQADGDVLENHIQGVTMLLQVID